MSLIPVSHYEALLAEVRGLRRKAQRVQLLATPLISSLNSTDIRDSSTSSQYNVSLLLMLLSLTLVKLPWKLLKLRCSQAEAFLKFRHRTLD